MKKLTLLLSTLMVLGIAQAQDTGADQNQSERAEHSKSGHGHHHRSRRGKMHKLMLKEVDTNKDGQIDLNEYLSHAEARFQKMDLNSDGFLTKEEGREAGKLMRAKMKEKRRELRELNEKQDSDQ